MDQPQRDAIAANLEDVRRRIAQAARRADRDPGAITLVAVTKAVGPEEAQRLIDLGVADLAENRPQELWRKAAAIHGPVRWHLIGQLQRNKVRRTLPLTTLIHSGDRWELLETLEQQAASLNLSPAVLLEVNVTGESTKSGWNPEHLRERCPDLLTLRHVRIEGLMTMASLVDDPEQARPAFAALRRLRDELHHRCDGRLPLPQLSMGMSNDFEIAVEEGATLVRIGTALFQPREDRLSPP